MVYYGLLWYIMINYDKLWYIMVYYGILWYIMVYYGPQITKLSGYKQERLV